MSKKSNNVPQPSAKKKFFIYAQVFIFGALIALVAISPLLFKEDKTKGVTKVEELTNTPSVALTLKDLIGSGVDEVENWEIGEMNLVASSGLPGSETLDIENALNRMDKMATHVQNEVKRNFHRYKANPYEYGGSEHHYKAGMLVTVIKQDFNLRYNEELRKHLDKFDSMSIYDDFFFKNAKNVFIGGLLGRHKQGTCSSMPVLLVAVARRCGYPVYLVASKGHLFCRWDDGKGTRFNFDGTGQGFSVHDDDYYMNFPRKITAQELEKTHLMKSMTPQQELATFLTIRRSCLQYHRKDTEALMCAARALHLDPKDQLNYIALASEGVLPPSVKKRLLKGVINATNNHNKKFDDEAHISTVEKINRENEARQRKLFNDIHFQNKQNKN